MSVKPNGPIQGSGNPNQLENSGVEQKSTWKNVAESTGSIFVGVVKAATSITWTIINTPWMYDFTDLTDGVEEKPSEPDLQGVQIADKFDLQGVQDIVSQLSHDEREQIEKILNLNYHDDEQLKSYLRNIEMTQPKFKMPNPIHFILHFRVQIVIKKQMESLSNAAKVRECDKEKFMHRLVQYKDQLSFKQGFSVKSARR